MNQKTTDKIIVYARNTESGRIRKVIFINLPPLYVTGMHSTDAAVMDVSFY